ncbi:MAG: metallophosphoesterase [Anaerolineae bacterium]|nr:metallophosphoesterase [Anaerolineae bacterium]
MPQLESAANLRRRYHDVELVLSCGDLSAAYLEFIVSVLNVPLFYVRGNHDEGYSQSPPGGEDLHQRVIKYNGLTFSGLEGSIRYNQGTIQYTEYQMNMMVIGMSGQLWYQRMTRGHGVDVFVTHSPARGIHDQEDLPHQGFSAFLKFMQWYRPRYMLHGHVHTYDRRKTTRSEYHDTCILNINPVTVLEIDPL